MALTWTRFIPDHYDNAAKSPPSLGDTVGGPSFPFMRLSAEIRLKVYKDYLIDRYSLQPQKSMKWSLILATGPKPRLRSCKSAKRLTRKSRTSSRMKTLSPYEYVGKMPDLMA